MGLDNLRLFSGLRFKGGYLWVEGDLWVVRFILLVMV